MIKFRFKEIPLSGRYKFFNTEEILPLKKKIHDRFGNIALVSDAKSIIFEYEDQIANFLLIKYPEYFEIVDK